MRAIVCDKCGKVILIPDRTSYNADELGIVHLSGGHQLGVDELDLCVDCGKELVEAVRNTVNT